MINVSIYEQDCHGRTHWRVMRDDGRLVFDDQHQVDFDSEQDAVSCIAGDFRRKKLGPVTILVKRLDRQSNGRHAWAKVIHADAGIIHRVEPRVEL